MMMWFLHAAEGDLSCRHLYQETPQSSLLSDTSPNSMVSFLNIVCAIRLRLRITSLIHIPPCILDEYPISFCPPPSFLVKCFRKEWLSACIKSQAVAFDFSPVRCVSRHMCFLQKDTHNKYTFLSHTADVLDVRVSCQSQSLPFGCEAGCIRCAKIFCLLFAIEV